ncbi:MAG: gluconeogenesis factor YvcK family protein [Candidatus Aquicultorales bacterium]
MDGGPSVVAIGGGTGLPVVLRAARSYAKSVTAVVTVADNGGSSGRLRRDLGILPPGDIRNCLVALADERSPLVDVFQYRFEKGSGIAGHAVGNLIIAALAGVKEDFADAIEAAGCMLGACGSVLPSTLTNVTLYAETGRGGRVVGQARVARTKKPIGKVFLDPEDPPAYGKTVEAIKEADQIVIGPGSLYTSILPNLLVPEIARGVCESKAKRVFVLNSMTQVGETSLCGAADHLKALTDHCGKAIDTVVANIADGQPDGLAPVEGKRHLIRPSAASIVEMGYDVRVADVADDEDPSKHDPDKLAEVLKTLV